MHKTVEELHKRNISFTCNSKIKVFKNSLDMEMHRIQGLPVFFGNLQGTFTMHCHNTCLKYKKKFKSTYACIIYSKRCKKFFKLQRKFIESIHIANEKPIQSFFHLNTSNTCQNSGNSLPMR